MKNNAFWLDQDLFKMWNWKMNLYHGLRLEFGISGISNLKAKKSMLDIVPDQYIHPKPRLAWMGLASEPKVSLVLK